MKKKQSLSRHIKIADMDAIKVHAALEQAMNIQSSLTPALLPSLSPIQDAFLDMLHLRFRLLQERIDAKIFPITLDLLGEDAFTFIDKLHRLERLGFSNKNYNANWWIDLRELRNQLNNDYADNYEVIAPRLSILLVRAAELLDFWEGFKKRLKTEENHDI